MRSDGRLKKQLVSDVVVWRIIEAIFTRRVGICRAIVELKWAGVITRIQYHRLMAVMDAKRPSGNFGYWWPLQEAERDENRVAFAKKMQKRAVKKKRRRGK